MASAACQHWPEYLIEAAGLGGFMIAAGGLATLLEHPASPVRQVVGSALLRRALMGTGMAATAMALVYSPWGKRSGAHFNPALTLTFLRLGKVALWDALFYVLAQFIGGLLGLLLLGAALGPALADPHVSHVATVPGPGGPWPAFVAEAAMSFVLMATVLTLTNIRAAARYTGLAVGALLLLYITFEAPLSGMSINPARTIASAVSAWRWDAIWVYFTAPPLGMLLAAELYQFLRGGRGVLCAKLHHHNSQRCIFRCSWASDPGMPG